ncbi:hypothetical protein [Deinococcus sp.]|uniref:hypothetical protein n=1 Tax=Deinococcus sp. TaxID=47478 RepID=UPI003C7DAFBE
MKLIAAPALILALTLAACNQANVSGNAKTYTFTAQTQTGYSAQAGKATRTDLNTNDTSTVLVASGLKPLTAYVAHYHAAGADVSKGVCASNGPIVGDQGSMTMIGGMTFTSDSAGAVTIRGLNTTATLSAAKYINIHEGAALAVVPLCADLTVAAK